MTQLNAGLPQTPAIALPKRVTVLNTPGSGTFQPLSGSTWRRVRMIAGGAGGCSGFSGTAPGACGARGKAGQYIELWQPNSTATVAWTVGAGGTGGAQQTGGSTFNLGAAGGNTVFGTLTATGGRAQITSLANQTGAYPDGDSSIWGVGGTGVTVGVSADAGAATGFGAGGGGGGGCATNNGTSGAGSNGTGGQIIIEEY
jgi:hypothetical protein